MAEPLTTKEVANMAIDGQIGTIPSGLAVLGGLTGFALASTVMPGVFALAFPAGAMLWLLRRTPSERDILEIEGGNAAKAFKFLTPAQRVQVQQRGVTVASLPPSPTPIQNHAHTAPNPQSVSPDPDPDHGRQSLAITAPNLPNPPHGGTGQVGNVAALVGGQSDGVTPDYSQLPAPDPVLAVDALGTDTPSVGGLAGAYGEVIASVTDMDGAHSKPRHLALLAVTQCGKTTTIAAIAHALKERYPDMAFHALDAKNSNWPQFFDSVCFPGYGLSFDAVRAIDAVRSVYRELERRVTGQLKGDHLQPRLLLVLDEWNKTREDIAAKVDKTLLQELDAMVGGIVFQGLEFGVHLCMVLQEANCTKIGLTDSGRLNIHFLALARAGERSMVDALLDNGMILKSKARCEALRCDFERVWNDRNRPPQSPVIVDSRTYQAESLPSMTFNLINHNSHDNSRNYSPTTQISRGDSHLSGSGLGVPSADKCTGFDSSDPRAKSIEPTPARRGITDLNGARLNADPLRNQKNGTANPTHPGAAVQLPPDPWGDDGGANDGEDRQDRGGNLGVGTGGADSPRPLGGMGAGANPGVTLPPDREILARFRSGWGVYRLAVEYGISNSGPEFEQLRGLEQQYKKEMGGQC